MSQHSDHQPQGDRPDPDLEPTGLDEEQDLHPAVDPREQADPVDTGEHREAPPMDIDEREGASTIHLTPDVIELGDQIDSEGQGSLPGPGLADPHTEELAPRVDASPDGDTAEQPSDPVHASDVTSEDENDAPSNREPGDSISSSSKTDNVSSRLAGAASRLRFGKLFETSDESGQRVDDRSGGQAGPGSGLADKVRSYLDPRLHMLSAIPHRRVLAVGAVLILLSLLANSAGLALIVLSAIVPVLIVITLTQHDVFEKESNLLVTAVGAAGAVVGLVLASLASWILASEWFDRGVLNFGAAGFGGRFAEAAGSAPFVVWLMVGLVIPALAIAGIAGIPIALRRWPQFRNEVMDGMILTGASAAGFAIGAGVIYWWPMIAEPGPQTNVSDWTLAIIGAAIVRPAVITLCGAMIGAGIWRYMVTPKASSAVVLPAVGGGVGFLLLTFGSIQLQAAGNWPEFLWATLLLAAVFVLYRRVLDEAGATDRRTLGDGQGRLVCPSCHKVTPAGAFCARCGEPLPRQGLPRVTRAGSPDHVTVTTERTTHRNP